MKISASPCEGSKTTGGRCQRVTRNPDKLCGRCGGRATPNGLLAMTAAAGAGPDPLSFPAGDSEGNDRRADRASAALAAYAHRAYDGTSEETSTALGDLLCDLRHLADRYGVDFGELDTRAEGNYEAETRGDAFDDLSPPAAGGDNEAAAWPPAREGDLDSPAVGASNARRLAFSGYLTDAEAAEAAEGDNDFLAAAVLSNPHCPPSVLAAAAQGTDPARRHRASSNPRCPPAARSAAGLLAD